MSPTEQGERLALADPADPTGAGHRADWDAAAAAVLRKARRLGEAVADDLAWERLATTTLDGITVTPLGTPDDVRETGAGRPARTGPWDIRTPLTAPEGRDAEALNEAALVDLENGATSLFLCIEEDAGDFDLATALGGVLLDLAPVTLDRPTLGQAEALASILESYDGTPAPGANLSIDPVTTEMLPHRVPDDGSTPADWLVPIARRALELGVLGVVVDGTALHDQGASDAQELGWTMAVGAHYLRLLTDAGISLDQALGLIEFRYAATDEQFPTIAKLRAARRCWARIVELSVGTIGYQRQHAVTSRPMLTTYDPYVNMLRACVAAFAAGVGGADAVTVLPFDTALGLPGAFGRRIARNVSGLLIEEAHVGAVADPVGGAYAVERLTDDLADAGWAELGRIEADGGVRADAARAGVKARVRDVVARRDAQIADRSRPITGVSEYPDPTETPPERAPASGPYARRHAKPYEELRDDPRGAVWLVPMGPVSAHTARAAFASNLFASGGIAATNPGPLLDADAVRAAYDADPAAGPVVCLVGTGAAYAEWGAAAVGVLREAGATHVILAGRPDQVGVEVDDSCAVGADVLAFLRRTREVFPRDRAERGTSERPSEESSRA